MERFHDHKTTVSSAAFFALVAGYFLLAFGSGCQHQAPEDTAETGTASTADELTSETGSGDSTGGDTVHGNSGVGACGYTITGTLNGVETTLYMCIENWPFHDCNGSDPRYEDSFHDSMDCAHAGYPHFCTPAQIDTGWEPGIITTPQWLSNSECNPTVEPSEGWAGDGVVNGG